MTTQAPKRTTRARVRRLVDAVQDAGMTVGAVEEAPDGTLRVIPATGSTTTDAADDWLNDNA